jgi:hypothetical protein
MSTVSVRLPNSLHRKLREVAKREGISINQFIRCAAAEKMAVMLAEECLEERARRGNRENFEAALAKLPDREPQEHDEL